MNERDVVEIAANDPRVSASLAVVDAAQEAQGPEEKAPGDNGLKGLVDSASPKGAEENAEEEPISVSPEGASPEAHSQSALEVPGTEGGEAALPKGPEDTLKKLSASSSLTRVFEAASLLENKKKVPSAEFMKQHLQDMQRMFDDRDKNPNFKNDMDAMMLGSNKLMNAMNKEIGELQKKGQPTPNKQVNELAQWIMNILQNLFGAKGKLSGMDRENMQKLENGMTELNQGMKDMAGNLDKYEMQRAFDRASHEGPGLGSGPNILKK